MQKKAARSSQPSCRNFARGLGFVPLHLQSLRFADKKNEEIYNVLQKVDVVEKEAYLCDGPVQSSYK